MGAWSAALAALIVLASIGGTMQNHPYLADPTASRRAAHHIIGQMVPAGCSRSPSPVGQAGHLASPPAWDPLGDRLFSMPGSPVTDSDSDVPRASSMSGNWAMGTAWGAEEFQLPPPQTFFEDEGSMDRTYVEPLTEDSAGSSDDGSALRRRCHLCKLMDATRGVAEDSDAGRWVTLVCRHCSQFIKNTVPLSTRCHSCRRYANFGPVGGTRRDARHCKKHRLPDEINVSRKRCDFRSEYSSVSAFHRHDGCPDVPIVSFKGSNFCAWHAQDLPGGAKGADSSESITVLPAGQKKSPRQCITEGCQLTASFGNADTSAIFCSFHRGPQHFDLVHKKRCEHVACERNPAYGLPSEGIARFCKEHRPGSFIDLRSRKCQYPYGCGKRPSFGESSDGIARFCAEHKLSQHINVKSRKCQEQGCAKQPTFGARSDMVVRFCAVHRRRGDVDLVHPRCRKSDCLKVALFGYEGGTAQLCHAHRQDQMVNINLLVRPTRGALRRSVALFSPDDDSSKSFSGPVSSWPANGRHPLVSPLEGWGEASPSASPAPCLSSGPDPTTQGGGSGRPTVIPLPLAIGRDAKRLHAHIAPLDLSREDSEVRRSPANRIFAVKAG